MVSIKMVCKKHPKFDGSAWPKDDWKTWPRKGRCTACESIFQQVSYAKDVLSRNLKVEVS